MSNKAGYSFCTYNRGSGLGLYNSYTYAGTK